MFTTKLTLHVFLHSALSLLTEFQSSDLEIDSNRRDKFRIERVVGESKYYTCLPNSAIAYEEKLEKQVEIRLRHFREFGAVLRDSRNMVQGGVGSGYKVRVERNRKLRLE